MKYHELKPNLFRWQVAAFANSTWTRRHTYFLPLCFVQVNLLVRDLEQTPQGHVGYRICQDFKSVNSKSW